MTTVMNALNSPSIRVAEFVKLTLPNQNIYFCNAASPIQVNGMTFTGLGSLLMIGEIDRSVKANSADLQISVNGIDPANVALVLGADLKGSKIEVWRGFLDTDNLIIQTPTQQFFKRYQGIINNISINEDWNEQLRERTATCIVTSASMRFVLDNRNAGLKTNPQVWKNIYANDTSMDRVPIIASTFFDFGKAPTGGSQSVAQPKTVTIGGQQYTFNYAQITSQ